MRAYTETLLLLRTPQKRFRRELVERLMSEYRALQVKLNPPAEIPFTDDNLPAVTETGELEWPTNGNL